MNRARYRQTAVAFVATALLVAACAGGDAGGTDPSGAQADPASQICDDSANYPRIRAIVCPSEQKGWRRIDDTTVSLTGEIVYGSFDQFNSVFDYDVTTVVVNSGGGDTYEGVMIGRALRLADVTVVVDGYCLSSCSNYIFTAGAAKDLRDGIVGFHGNNRTAVAEAGSVAAAFGVEPGENAEMDSAIERYETAISLESEFFEELEISQQLFEFSQNPSGAHAGAIFIVPTVASMNRFGIGNITGPQSETALQNLVEVLGPKFAVVYDQ